MKKIVSLLLLLASVGLATGSAQSSLPKVEINSEPILTLDLKQELVEITPDGIRKLGGSAGRSGLRVGSSGKGALSMPDRSRVEIETKLLELGKDRIVLEVSVIDGNTRKLLAGKTLTLTNYQEALVDLASAASGSRIALRLLPTVANVEAVRDYPLVVRELALENSMLIVNSKEILARPTLRASVDNLDGTEAQFLIFESSRFGRLVLSYRPFAGATVRGYIQGRKLIFEWDGNVFEWISMEKPILPEGKWALYVAQTAPPGAGFSQTVFGIRTGKPGSVK